MSLPVIHNLTAYRGDTWSQVFRLSPANLTGATVESEARAPNGSITPLVVVIEDAADGRIRLELPTGFAASSYQFDVEVTEVGGKVTTWIKGTLTVMRDVTNEVATP